MAGENIARHSTAMDFGFLHSSLLQTLGESVTYRPASGALPEFDVSVIWTADKAAQNVNAAAAAVALIRLSDFTVLPKKGDEIERGGKVYRVVESPEDGRDGMGGCVLILRYVREAV